MKYLREIEKKFIIADLSYKEASERLLQLINTQFYTVHPSVKSYDLFWQADNVDFIRLRKNSNELTFKATDKGTVVDRIEENVVISEFSYESARRFCIRLFGKPRLKLTKEFLVVSVNYKKTIVHVSIYRIDEDPENRTFLEVEANSVEIVDAFIEEVMPSFKWRQEMRSLFSIFTDENI